MAYQTGTSSGIADLLDKLGVFAAANGWTQNRRDASSLSISKGAIFQNLEENGSTIRLNGATGFSAGSAWNAQAGADSNVQKSTDMPGSFTRYHFFTDSSKTYLHTVVEVDPGLYRHLVFGEVKKTSAYNGGQYSCAIWLNPSIITYLFSLNFFAHGDNDRVDVCGFRVYLDGQNNWKHFNPQSRSTEFAVFSTESYGERCNPLYSDWVLKCSPNTFNALTALAPIQIFVDRGSGVQSPLGYVEDLRQVNMQLFDPGQSVFIGSNEWLLFPADKKGPVTDNPGVSGLKGYAYKKIP